MTSDSHQGHKSHKTLKLPQFHSQAQMAASTGIAVAAIKAAKAAGCPAFQSSVIDLRRFLEWSFSDGRDNSGATHKERKEKADADLAEIKVAQARAQLVDVENVKRWAEGVFTAFRQGVLASSLTDPEKDELIGNCRKLVTESIGLGDDADTDSEIVEDLEAAPESESSGMVEQASVPTEGEFGEAGEISD